VRTRTTREVGAAIREQRKAKNLTQAELAESVGVTRAWIIAIEQGKASAELGLVLRTLANLGLVADIVPAPKSSSLIDLDELLAQ
jgi:HTH-type transcriptional regulator / antitoxin HipB